MAISTLKREQEITRRVLSHISERFHNTEYEEEPFPHFEVTEIFPTDIYEQLIDSLPDLLFYSTASERYQREDDSFQRHQFWFTRDNMRKLPSDLITFWTVMKKVLDSNILKQLIFEKLNSRLHIVMEFHLLK